MGSLRAVALLQKVPPLKDTGTQVPNATLDLMASAGAHMPRAQHPNGNGNKDGNLRLWLPEGCLCSNIKLSGQHRVSNSMLNSFTASELPVKG